MQIFTFVWWFHQSVWNKSTSLLWIWAPPGACWFTFGDWLFINEQQKEGSSWGNRHLCHTCQPHPYHHTDHQTVLFSSTRRSRQKLLWVYLLFHSCRCLWHVDLHLVILRWQSSWQDAKIQDQTSHGIPFKGTKRFRWSQWPFPLGDSTILLFVCMTVWFICGQRPLCNRRFQLLSAYTHYIRSQWQVSWQWTVFCNVFITKGLCSLTGESVHWLGNLLIA